MLLSSYAYILPCCVYINFSHFSYYIWDLEDINFANRVVFLVGSLIMFRSACMWMWNSPRRQTIVNINLFLRLKLTFLYSFGAGGSQQTPFLLCQLSRFLLTRPMEAQREMTSLEEEGGA